MLTFLQIGAEIFYPDALNQEKFEESREQCEQSIEKHVEKDVGEVTEIMERIGDLVEKRSREAREALKSRETGR